MTADRATVAIRERPSAFAARLGVARSTITRAIQRGSLLLGEDGRLDVADSLQRWQQTTSGLRPDVAARHADRRRESAAICPAQEDSPSEGITRLSGALLAPFSDLGAGTIPGGLPGGPPEPGTLPYWTARRLAAQNALALISLQLRQHQRYPMEDIRREAYAIGSVLRGALDRMVDQSAPRLVAAGPEERARLLGTELALIHRTLRAEFLRAMRRIRKS